MTTDHTIRIILRPSPLGHLALAVAKRLTLWAMHHARMDLAPEESGELSSELIPLPPEPREP